MPNLQYVCLSDIHLGADYSVLTPTKADLEAPGPVLTAFAAALAKLLAGVPTSPSAPPRLVLVGDVLDLGLSPVERVAKGFVQFVRALFTGPTASPLAPHVQLIPGNHDHQVWQWCLEGHYVEKMAKGDMANLKPVTHLFPKPGTPNGGYPKSLLLTTLMQTVAGAAAEVRVAYPNFGALTAERRCVVFHHGHFIESMYRMMSDVRRFLRLGGPRVQEIGDLEAENAAWIDFVWSTFGETGVLGKDMGRLYERLQDAAANAALTGELAQRLSTRLLPYLPMGGERLVATWTERVVHALLDATVERMGELERNSYWKALTDDTIDGLRWYLDVPLAQQLEHDLQQKPADALDDVVFVFGHTHKPFQDAIALERYKRPVRLFNTGGWVLDEPTLTSLEGASLVLVDDDLNVVSVRLFNQSTDAMRAVHVPEGGADPAVNPLLDAVTKALAEPGTAAAWSTFSTAVSDTMLARQRALIQRFDLPKTKDAATTARGGAR